MTELTEIEEMTVNDVVTHFKDPNVCPTYVLFMDNKREAVRVSNELRQRSFTVKLTPAKYQWCIFYQLIVSRK